MCVLCIRWGRYIWRSHVDMVSFVDRQGTFWGCWGSCIGGRRYASLMDRGFIYGGAMQISSICRRF